MKTKSPAILFAIAATAILGVTPKSLAKDCPTVADEVINVTVKGNTANLRKTPEVEDNNLAGSAKSGTQLELLDKRPTSDNKYCWYKVKSTEGNTLWIAETNIETLSETSNSKVRSPRDAKTTDPTDQQTIKETPQDLKVRLPKIVDWIFKLGMIGGLALGAWAFVRLRKDLDTLEEQVRILKKANKELAIELESKSASIENISDQSSKNHREIGKIQKYHDFLEEKYNTLELKVQALPTKFIKSLPPNSLPIQPISTLSRSNEDNPKTIFSKEIKTLISRFNSQDIAYFRDQRFNPIKLSQESIQGTVGLDGRRVIRLEPAQDISQAYYLEVLLDNENWLIPNAASMYFQQILNNLKENPEIFVIVLASTTNQFELVRPAKLKSVGSGSWEVVEPGEFQA